MKGWDGVHNQAWSLEQFKKHWPEIKSWPQSEDVKHGLEMFEYLVNSGYKIGYKDLRKEWGLI